MYSAQHNNILIVVSGPTGVGKTNCSIQLAKVFNADIFSSDSRQLYREMSIGTAKPTEKDMQGVKHHFIDCISIKQNYDVGSYENDTIGKLGTYFQKNKYAILTGGTGLYIQAITDGIDKFPDIPEKVIDSIKQLYLSEGIESLQLLLKDKDPDYYKQVDSNNPHRLMRALSVIIHTGKTFSSFLTKKNKTRDFKAIHILLNRDRQELYERINKRVDQMIESGLIEEAKSLYEFRHLKSLQTVGYQELFHYFEGTLTLEEAVSKIKQNSRNYAKRQLTWFRKDPRWKEFHPDHVDDIIKYIRKI